jgi:hypothetical protein
MKKEENLLILLDLQVSLFLAVFAISLVDVVISSRIGIWLGR